MPIVPRWRSYFHSTFYSSGTVAADDDTGIIATPLVVDGGDSIFPLFFVLVGSDMTGDETNDITIDWYGDSAGTGGAIGTTTFAQLLVGNLTRVEAWPGDFSFYDSGRDMVPLHPFHKITWDVAGVAPAASMSFIIYLSYQIIAP